MVAIDVIYIKLALMYRDEPALFTFAILARRIGLTVARVAFAFILSEPVGTPSFEHCNRTAFADWPFL